MKRKYVLLSVITAGIVMSMNACTSSNAETAAAAATEIETQEETETAAESSSGEETTESTAEETGEAKPEFDDKRVEGMVTSVDGGNVTISVMQGPGGQGMQPPQDGQAPEDGATPPEKPDGDTQETPPDKPEGGADNAAGDQQTPPEKPDGDNGGAGGGQPQMPGSEAAESKTYDISAAAVKLEKEGGSGETEDGALSDVTEGVMISLELNDDGDVVTVTVKARPDDMGNPPAQPVQESAAAEESESSADNG